MQMITKQVTVVFPEYGFHACSKSAGKNCDPLISPSIGYISAGGNVGYIFCKSQLQFDTWQSKGIVGRLFKSSILIIHVAINIGPHEI